MYRALQTDFESLPQLLAARAGEIGAERFVRDAEREWTYGEFHARVTEVAGGLEKLGVGQGDVVGHCTPTAPITWRSGGRSSGSARSSTRSTRR